MLYNGISVISETHQWVIISAIASMKISPKQYAILLYELTQDVKKNAIEERTRAFLNLLLKQRALNQLPRILRFYSQYYNVQEGVIDVEVTTAREAGKIEDKIKNEIKIENKIELKKKVDPSLIGGVRIKVGDYMIDDTVRARLRALRSIL